MSNPTNNVPFNKLNSFLKDGSRDRLPSKADMHILAGWKNSTLIGYNSAVTKFVAFRKSEKVFDFSLPIAQSDLENFCIWAGRNAMSTNDGKISSKSLAKYIAGLRAWHTYHNKAFPGGTKARLDLLLKASARFDESTLKTSRKQPMMLWHMVHLWKSLVHGDDFDRAVLDVCVVAFWGLARLAEVTYAVKNGSITYADSILVSDVVFTTSENLGGVVTLTVRNAKTAAPGEPQIITLCEQQHVLCPVAAIRRRLSESPAGNTSLFGYSSSDGRVHLTRSAVVTRMSSVLTEGGFVGLKGHSFRVGGASMRVALGMSHKDLCSLGRWKSISYQLYVRKYDEGELRDTRSLLKELKRSWDRMFSMNHV
jgi:hypothetical protein